MTIQHKLLHNLPHEIMLCITSLLTCKDMSNLRLVSKALRTFCDHPMNWKALYLEPEKNQPLWQLGELKSILLPHVSYIKSIHIWGVRDNIIYYLLSQCKNLQHLTICGWTTLSDHCLRLQPAQSLKIKTLELIGSPKQSNYISVDAHTLGNLMIQSPQMTNLVLGCEAHIHAETFVSQLEKAQATTTRQLQLFALATRRTWLNEHLVRMINLYPSIESLALLPSVAEGFDLVPGFEDALEVWFKSKLKQAESIPITQCRYSLISSEDMILYIRELSTSATIV